MAQLKDTNNISSKVEVLEQESEETIKELKEKIEEKEGLYLRTLADFDNYRKRMEKEVEIKGRQREEELILELLDEVDNLERAQSAGGDDLRSFKNGIRAIYQNLMKILKKRGVVPIKSIGEEFDPRLHEAVGSMKSENFPPGIIGEEIRKGYLMEDGLLRASLVWVVKN